VDQFGRSSLLSQQIDVGDAKPVKQRHFRVDRMLPLGVIEFLDL